MLNFCVMYQTAGNRKWHVQWFSIQDNADHAYLMALGGVASGEFMSAVKCEVQGTARAEGLLPFQLAE